MAVLLVVAQLEVMMVDQMVRNPILNGEVMQDWNTDDMIFDVPTLIEFLSASTTLAPGTVIITGTPHGIGAARKPPVFLKNGDSVTIEIERIGALSNPVSEEQV